MSETSVVPIDRMAAEQLMRIPAQHRALLEQAGCLFDKWTLEFVRDGRSVIGYASACDRTLVALRVAIAAS